MRQQPSRQRPAFDLFSGDGDSDNSDDGVRQPSRQRPAFDLLSGDGDSVCGDGDEDEEEESGDSSESDIADHADDDDSPDAAGEEEHRRGYFFDDQAEEESDDSRRASDYDDEGDDEGDDDDDDEQLDDKAAEASDGEALRPDNQRAAARDLDVAREKLEDQARVAQLVKRFVAREGDRQVSTTRHKESSLKRLLPRTIRTSVKYLSRRGTGFFA